MNNLDKSFQVTIENNFSALGDTVCSLPAIKALIMSGALDKLYTTTQWMPLYSKIVPKDKLVDGEKLEDKKITYPFKMVLTWVQEITTINMHLVDYCGVRLADAMLLDDDRNYPLIQAENLKYDLPEKYVAIGINRTSPMRNMNFDVYSRIVSECFRLGYDVVLLGKKYAVRLQGDKFAEIDCEYDPMINERIIDLREKTELMQAHAVIANAKAFVCMDGGLMHLAGCTDVHIIAGLTCVRPEYRLPIRHGQLGWNMKVLTPTSECKYCYNQRLIPRQDFAHCGKGTFECVASLTPDRWSDAIVQALMR